MTEAETTTAIANDHLHVGETLPQVARAATGTLLLLQDPRRLIVTETATSLELLRQDLRAGAIRLQPYLLRRDHLVRHRGSHQRFHVEETQPSQRLLGHEVVAAVDSHTTRLVIFLVHHHAVDHGAEDPVEAVSTAVELRPDPVARAAGQRHSHRPSEAQATLQQLPTHAPCVSVIIWPTYRRRYLVVKKHQKCMTRADYSSSRKMPGDFGK